jgi:hypothetical protein
LNLEHYRKEAKRLLRAVKAGAPDALPRAGAVLGDRVNARFVLSDALHVIAREQGHRSWPEFKQAVEQAQAITQAAANDPERIETIIDTPLEYRPADPVRVRVVRRGPRTWVSDDGAAFERAGRPRRWHQAARRVEQELVVNFSRTGVISLPVVPAGPSEAQVVQRIGEASRAFYQELLELT